MSGDAVYDYVRAMRLWWDQRGCVSSWQSGESSDLGDWWTMQNARSVIVWELEKGRLDR